MDMLNVLASLDEILWYSFAEKIWVALAMQKPLTFKSIRVLPFINKNI